MCRSGLQLTVRAPPAAQRAVCPLSLLMEVCVSSQKRPSGSPSIVLARTPGHRDGATLAHGGSHRTGSSASWAELLSLPALTLVPPFRLGVVAPSLHHIPQHPVHAARV